jgi:hypothetical protein
VTCEAEWNGGAHRDDVQVAFEDDSSTGNMNITRFAESHFGSGILTFSVGVVIRTPPNCDLWVTGPPNEFKDGIQPLSGVVETYWMPFTFTMNWKFTRPNLRVRFEKGEPFCFFFPVQHGLLEQINPVFERLADDPELEKQYRFALYKRALPNAVKRLKGEELKIAERERFEGWYIRGEMPDGTETAGHKRRLELKPFTMRPGRPAGDSAAR